MPLPNIIISELQMNKETAKFNALIVQAKKKDAHAISILSKYCIDAIKLHLSLKFRNRQEIEDWAHDVFTYKIYSNLPNYLITNPIAWLNKVADNYVFTILKKEHRTVEYVENVYSNERFVDIVNGIMLEEAFKDVDEQTTQILVLKHIYGYRFREIAKLLKINEDAARQRASRTRRKLKDIVTKLQ